MLNDAADWHWNNYNAMTGQAPALACLQMEALLSQCASARDVAIEKLIKPPIIRCSSAQAFGVHYSTVRLKVNNN